MNQKQFKNSDLFTNQAKFTLFLKAHEIKQIQKSLKQVLLLPKKDRERWIKEYGDMLHDAFDEFIAESDLALENLSFDSETIQLSEDFVVSLRDTVNLVEGIFAEVKPLRS